jgi:exodeoxyribonuclease VII small subunit
VSESSGEPARLEAIQPVVRDGSFEDSLAALEAVVAHLERGRLSIDEAIAWYEAGLGLMRRCSDLLEQAELRVRTLEETYTTAHDGMSPWDADAP